MKTAKQIIEEKGNQVWSVEPDNSVFDTIKMMAEKKIGALLVIENNKTVGIISERDYARKIILEGRNSKDTRVGEIMTSDLIAVTPEQNVNECLNLMSDHHIRHLPVISNGELSGMLSVRDLMAAIIEDQQFQIEQLEQYVRG
ncbi:MAG: CBS domain-containing protein [Arenicellales bacterium WSBS_2016_MAG_OTU3]